MAKQLNVSLAFSADTGKVKQQIAELDKMLTNLSVHASKSNSLGLDKELTKSVEKAAELKAILNSSLDTKGGLDLGKFNSELKKSKTNLKDYASSLIHLGPQGEQAFIQLARSISAAEVPLKRSNAMLREFATTLKNTARWQISSSILHGFMGTLQSAYGYAEDLNESLNNIRIVTGQSTEQMAKFAKEANRAAKELNTTTTSYTDAALIYYQQGLSDKQVKERTEVTVKMANVARESATEVSSYMTAIWNNFDKEGTQSLEHFGDVITALGAATAASTEEIAHGLEKFAAVADTIGLSYEYATSAIATIVDKTRQSEDVVGTALKTIFARIQGLSLGETLEDGTSLNKYSEALASVGINIIDATGNLKDMDTILDEMGAKWQMLSKDQQVALAQTVAGVRQYNQLVSLMDNYDAFKGNVDIANNSDGALQGQADIYAESWEAARDRVQAAAEGLYDSLLNDDFFITLLNSFEKLLTTLENVIDGFGGMGGAIALAGSLLFKHFGPDIAESIDNGIYNMTLRSENGLKEILRLREKASEELKKTFSDTTEDTQHVYSPANVKGEVYSKEAELQDEILLKNEELLAKGKKMSEIEQQKLQIMIDESRVLGEIAVNKSKAASESNDNLQTNNKEIVRKYGSKYSAIEGKGNLSESLKTATNLEKKYAALDKTYLRVKASQKAFGEDISKATDYIKKMCSQLDMNEEEIEEFMKTFEGCSDIESIINALGTKVEELGEQAQSAFNDIDEGTGAIKDFSDVIKQAQQEAWNTGNSIGEAGKAMVDYEEYTEKTSKSIRDAKEEAYSFGECVGALGNGIMTLASATTTLVGLGSIWNDEDLSLGEKILTTVTTLGAVIPMLTEAYSKENLEKIKSIGLSTKELILSKGIQLGKLGEKATVDALNASLTKEIILETIKQALDWKKLAITLAIVAVLGTLIAITMAVVNAIKMQNETEERANAIAEKSVETYNKLKESYDNLKQSIEDYQDAYNAFKKLSESADEYAEALENANEKAKALIEQHGLYGDWRYGEKGEIQIDQNALDRALNEANQKQLNAATAAASAKVMASQVKKDEIYDAYGYWNMTSLSGQGTVDEEGFFVPDSRDGSSVLDQMAGLTSEQFQAIANNADLFNEVLFNSSDEVKANLESLSKDIGVTSEDFLYLSHMIYSMGDAAEDYYNTLVSVNNQLGYQLEDQALKGIQSQGLFGDNVHAQQAYANLLAQDADYQNAAIKNAKDASGISEGGDNGLKDILERTGNYSYGKVFSDKDLAKAYAKHVEGWTDEQIEDAKIKDGWGKSSMTSGDLEIATMSEQEMRDALANTLLAEELAKQSTGADANVDYGEQIRADINKISSSSMSESASNAVLGALSNYQQGSELKLDSSLLSPDDIAELENVMDEIGSDFGTSLTEAVENYDPSKYFERLEAQQSANIDNQIATEGLDADVIATQTELIMENTEALEDNENAAKQLAVNNTRMNKGVETLIDNWDDWNKTLKNSDKTSEEYARTITEMRSCLGDLVGLTDNLESSLSTSFFESAENLELMERAANADTEAIRELGNAVAQDLAKGMEIADEFVSVFDEADAKLTFGDNVYTSLDQLQVAFGTAKANVLSVIDEISQAELKLGDDLASAIGDDDMQKFVDGLNQMAIMTNMSVADMQGMLNSLGVEANVTEEWVPETVKVPVYETHKEPIEYDGDTPIAWKEWSTQVDTEEMEGGRMVASIKYSEDGSESGSPQISYVGHGNISTGNKTKAADAAKKRSGGSDKKKKSEKGKTQKEEVDRYHEIKEVLDDLGRELDRIGKKKDRAWGGGKLAAINAETQAIKNQLGALKQYHSQISANLGSDRANASSYGWSFDGNGNVSNYEGTLAGLINEYNAAVEAFNNSAQEDADQEALDKAKEHYEEAKDALAQYEETKDLYEDVLDQITEATYALADAELEAIEYSVEIKLELDDNKLKLLEDIMETIGDSAARAVDNIEMIEKSIDTVLHQMETSKDGMKSIFDYIGLSGDVADRIMNGTASEGDQKSLAEILNSYGGAIDMDRVVSDLQQYQDNLLSYNEALRNYRDQVFDTVNNALSEHLEDFDRANDKIAHCVNLVSGYKDLIEAIGRKNIDVHGELTQKLNQALRAQAEDAHRTALAKEAYAQEAYQKALEGYQTAIETGDEYAINKWTEILETAQDELQAAKEDSQSALTEWANAIAESFSGAIQKVIDDLDSALGGLTQLRDQFDMAQEIDAQYLDDYQKIYELSKLTREVQASIDETDNVAAKKALMEYQQKITEYQREGVQMSQYELDYLRAEYDLEMAKIAMEEARNAKSQVTMTKDSEGNYSYVYTADDAAVEQAEQSYEDRLYAMQQLNGQYINELQSNILTMQEELSARLEEIANDDSLSYQDKMAKMQEVTDYYTERIQYYNEQLTICIDNNKSLYEDEWTDYHNKTGYKISANEDYVDSWDETTLAILTNVESQEEYMKMLEDAINHAKEEAINACDEAMEALDEAGMTAEELGDTISNVTDELVNDAEEAANSAEQMSEEYQNAMDEIMDAAITFTSAYAAMISSTIAQNQQLISSMQQVIQMALQMKATLASVSNSSAPGSGGPGSGSGNPGNGANATALANEAMAIVKGVHNGSIPQTSSGWQPSARSQGYSDSAISIALKAFNDSKSGAGYDYYYQKALQIAGSYDTGGYTGSWGTSEGRLALLHQKELVLNAQDTPNLLDAIGIVRDIAKAIDINALSAMVNGGFSAVTVPNNQNEILEQNVHITAEFPNATNKNEILEAFDNVINLAAQYANRKN